MSDVTRILSKIEAGDQNASRELLPLVYEELRRLASAKMAQENPGLTLQATALVHEAYVRLVDVPQAQQWDSRGHFFTAAAEAMRRILIERARKQGRLKRGGRFARVDIDAIDIAGSSTPEQLLAIDEALSRFVQVDPDAAALVQLRYFAGLTIKQAAEALQISTRSAYRHWNFARAWLYNELLEKAD